MICPLYVSISVSASNVTFFFFFGYNFVCSEIEIKSDTTLAEAVKILAEHNILSAPVVDVDAPEDASWIDRYIGIVEFAGIVVWILHQVGISVWLISYLLWCQASSSPLSHKVKKMLYEKWCIYSTFVGLVKFRSQIFRKGCKKHAKGLFCILSLSLI